MSKDYPQHWDIATEHGFWDMTGHHDVRRGDHVYFWLSRASFLDRTKATSDAYEIRPRDHQPWEDSGERRYRWRFTFDLLSEAPTGQPRWGEVAEQLSNPRISLQAPRRFDNPRDEAVLASYFPGQEAPSVRLEDRMHALLADAGIDVPELDLAALDRDERTFAERLISVREGQQRFRSDLLTIYGRCAVTGTDVPDVLEAAHIARYGGAHTNQIRNGLLLRRDIHRLFDAGLLTITDEYVVRVDPSLRHSTYGALDGQDLAALPGKAGHRPSLELLIKRNEQYPWLAG